VMTKRSGLSSHEDHFPKTLFIHSRCRIAKEDDSGDCSPSHRCTLSVFFALARYSKVKIVSFCSKVVLRTIKHTKIYPSLGLSLKVIALRSVV
jgi:hypothetical protein